ncbi:MAG: biopolymer transporter ExbD [Ramlibacter sp.]
MKTRMRLKARRFAPGDPEVMMDINTTPLIDVMLVLLVMLIITIPIQLHAVNLAMPVAVAPPEVPPAKVQVDIDDRSVVHWQGRPVTAQELEEQMAIAAQQPVAPEIHLRASGSSRYAVFANVLSAAKRQGLAKIAVVGNEQFVR